MTKDQSAAGAATENHPNPEQTSQVEARLGMLLARVGEPFSADELAHLRRDIAREVELADRLRAVPLTNGDEPGTIFVPYRAEGDR